MKRIDTRGTLCPAPLIMTKRAMKESPDGGKFEVLADNDIAVQNLLRYLKELNIETAQTKSGEITSILFVIGSGNKLSVQESKPELFCSVPSNMGRYAVVLKSTIMGDGDRELGELLLRSCLNSLIELDSLPSSIILYNDGVKLAIDGSDTSMALKKLESAGVELLICGACVDYYELKESIKIGVISNMYKINSVTSTASHVVYP